MKIKTRDTSLDAMKGLLIFLVVLGHITSHYSFLQLDHTVGRGVHTYLYHIIFSFHMPAFVFLSGYFSKNAGTSAAGNTNLLKNILIPFLVFQFIRTLFFLFSFNTEIFFPKYTLWYLLCVFIWRLIVHPISRLKFALPLSFILALMIGGTQAEYYLSISRMFCFFPYFLAGYLFSSDLLERIRRISRAISLAVFVAITASVIFLININLPMTEVFKMATPYASYNLSALHGIVLRVIAYIIGFAMTFSLLSLSFKRPNIFIKWGNNSMPIYLLHSLVIQGYTVALVFSNIHIPCSDVVFSICSFAAAVGLTFLLGSMPVSRCYAAVMNSIVSVVLKKEKQTIFLTHDSK